MLSPVNQPTAIATTGIIYVTDDEKTALVIWIRRLNNIRANAVPKVASRATAASDLYTPWISAVFSNVAGNPDIQIINNPGMNSIPIGTIEMVMVL